MSPKWPFLVRLIATTSRGFCGTASHISGWVLAFHYPVIVVTERQLDDCCAPGRPRSLLIFPASPWCLYRFYILLFCLLLSGFWRYLGLLSSCRWRESCSCFGLAVVLLCASAPDLRVLQRLLLQAASPARRTPSSSFSISFLSLCEKRTLLLQA